MVGPAYEIYMEKVHAWLVHTGQAWAWFFMNMVGPVYEIP